MVKRLQRRRVAALRDGVLAGPVVITGGLLLVLAIGCGGISRSDPGLSRGPPILSAARPPRSPRRSRRAIGSHALQVVANIRADPPVIPLVFMLGGSAVRESTISDASWAADVERAGGPRLETYNLGSSNQSFAQDLKLVPYLPQVPLTIVYIGVNLGRFVWPPANFSIRLPAPKPVPASYRQHHYSGAHILSVARKRALVTDWKAQRYSVFSRYYAYNLGVLEKLIKACLARGLHPVLLDEPRNTAIIGHALDKPVSKYHSSVEGLAKQYGIPFVDMVADAHLTNKDFFDLWHLVPPGRGKWQTLLSRETVQLLNAYGTGQ